MKLREQERQFIVPDTIKQRILYDIPELYGIKEKKAWKKKAVFIVWEDLHFKYWFWQYIFHLCGQEILSHLKQ